MYAALGGDELIYGPNVYKSLVWNIISIRGDPQIIWKLRTQIDEYVKCDYITGIFLDCLAVNRTIFLKPYDYKNE